MDRVFYIKTCVNKTFVIRVIRNFLSNKLCSRKGNFEFYFFYQITKNDVPGAKIKLPFMVENNHFEEFHYFYVEDRYRLW